MFRNEGLSDQHSKILFFFFSSNDHFPLRMSFSNLSMHQISWRAYGNTDG